VKYNKFITFILKNVEGNGMANYDMIRMAKSYDTI